MLGLVLLVGVLLGLASPALADSSMPVEVTIPTPATAGPNAVQVANAQFRWGLNNEAGSGAFFGGCNFLSAGKAGNSGGSRLWTDADNGKLFRASEGPVRIEKPVGKDYKPLVWADRCLNDEGQQVSASSLTGTGVQAVIDGGTGYVDRTTKTAQISWKGSFSVVFYGGLTYWWVSDPVLTVNADGTGVVSATAGGFGADMADSSHWAPLTETPVVLANLTGITLEERGFATDPRYREVAISLPASATAQVRTGAAWGSFPQNFVNFQLQTGQAGYWYSSGGARDGAKVATTLYISYDASVPVSNAGNSQPVANTGGSTLPDLSGGAGANAGAGAGGGGTAGAQNPAGVANTGASGPAITGAGASNIVPIGADTVLPNAALIPDYFTGGNARELLPWAVSLLLLLASVSWIGFQRGWLQLPFRAAKNPTPITSVTS